MDEFQLVETYREGFAVQWAQLQWWASVSFGLLALASFGRRHLSLVVTIGLSTLYVLFSIFSAINIYAISVTIVTTVSELSALEGVSAVGETIVSSLRVRQVNALVGITCFFATFGGTLIYLWYSYRKNKAAAA